MIIFLLIQKDPKYSYTNQKILSQYLFTKNILIRKKESTIAHNIIVIVFLR